LDAERCESLRNRRIGERASTKRDGVERAVPHVDLVVVKIGSVQQLSISTGAEGQSLVYRARARVVLDANGVRQVNGRVPSGKDTVLGHEQERRRTGLARGGAAGRGLRHDEARRTVED